MARSLLALVLAALTAGCPGAGSPSADLGSLDLRGERPGFVDGPAADLGPDLCSADALCGGQCCQPDQVCVAGACTTLPPCVEPYPCPTGFTCNPSTIHITDAASLATLRQAVVALIWKGQGLPTRLADKIESWPLAQSPIAGVENLAALQRLTVTMPLTAAEGGGAFTSIGYHFRPQTRLDRLVVYHQGHSDTLGLNGGDAAVRFLVKRGYDVVALGMPLKGENTGPSGYSTHDDMMQLESASRSPIQFFVEPVAVALNQLRQQHSFTDVSMIGISGGGWTTHVYAALDPSIRHSFPVAGSLPFDLPDSSSVGDGEQVYPALFKQTASYRDLYIMGGAGAGRSQVQVLNRYDSCCFSGTGYRDYENRVRAIARTLGGSFDAYLDASHQGHEISPHVLAAVVLPALEEQPTRLLEETDDGFGYPGAVYGEAVLQGSWTPYTDGQGGKLAFAAAGAGEARASWLFGNLKPGSYRISVTWTPHANRATNAPFSILDGSTPVAQLAVDQTQAPASRSTMGAQWHDLGTTHTITGSALTVRLTNQADGYVIADAVRIERIAPGTPLCK